MSILVLAEKPSVARDIARVLGARRKGDGFLEGNGYRVTWAIGHLVQFAEPDDYGARGGETPGVDWSGSWSMAQLPMIPARWKLQTAKRTAEQFKRVAALINAPETERLVCATDAGREGEHIFRLIYEHARCTKPFDRLWISSLTDEAIAAGFRALRPGTAYAALAAAARARAQADWLIGMNLTRAYTVHNRVLCTIGRVQTPTLAMIVARDEAIARFVKTPFYELVAHLLSAQALPFEARYIHDGETRIEKKEDAERLQRDLSVHRTGTVSEVETHLRVVRPPPLYDLTNLQRDANRRFGLTAAQVLAHAQTLYETYKLISYPRTESRHIAEDMVPELPGILRALDHPLAAEALARLESGHRLSKTYVDRTKLTDHHAILPTGKTPTSELPAPLRGIYDLVVARFIAVFLPDQRIEETRVLVRIAEATFVARGARVLELGWKRVESRERETPRPGGSDAMPAGPATEGAADETARALPPLAEGEVVQVERLEVQEKETQPPRHYDDATLLAAMKNAGRDIEDDALAAAMKQSGLGTPATRAEIIEKLIRTRYVERQRKQLRATPKGIALIGAVVPALCSPELTAGWEQRLKDVEQGELAAEVFYRDILDFLRALLPQIAQGPALSAEQVAAERSAGTGRGRAKAGTRKGRGTGRGRAATRAPATGLGPCPLCGEGEVVETARAYGCSRFREGCGLTIWKTLAGLTLSEPQVKALLEQGRIARLEGFTSKTGKPFGAGLRLDERGRVAFDFTSSPRAAVGQAPATALGAQPPRCPKCGQGTIIEGRRGFGCNRYREGCDFVIWKRVAGVTLDASMIRALIEHGETAPIQGLEGVAGAARLRLDADWQVLIGPETP